MESCSRPMNFLLAIIVPLLLCVLDTSAGCSMPDGWDKICTTNQSFVDWNFTTLPKQEVKSMLQLSCRLGDGDFLRFTEIRNWTESCVSPRKVALQVDCSGSAVLSAPWPMKARHLVFVRITGCIVGDILTEFSAPIIEKLPDEIRVIEMVDIVVPVTISDIIGLVHNFTSVLEQADCGPQTAEKMVLQGIVPDIPFLALPDMSGDWDDMDNVSFENPAPSQQNTSIDCSAIVSRREQLNKADHEFMVALCLDSLFDDLFSDTDYFQHKCNFKELRHLDESNSPPIPYVYLGLLSKNSAFNKLNLLNLSRVMYDFIPSELLDWRSPLRFPKLKYLDLSHNQISNFSFRDLGTGELEQGIIDLRFNNISVLPKATLDNLEKLKTATVLLQNNPFNCTCGVVADLYRLLTDGTDLGRYEYFRTLQCASPADRRGIEIAKLTEDQVICPSILPPHVIWLISALSVVVLLLGLTIFLIVQFRRELIILTYRWLNIDLVCTKTDPLPSEGKVYDMFVSACDEDSDWVETYMISILKNQKKQTFRTCLRGRDWDLGIPLADNAVKSIETSVHTVAVVSRDYLADEWRHFEFSVALHQSLREKRRHLVVIFKENVDKDALAPEMRKYVEITPCIHFNKRLYTDRLLYALSHYERQEVCFDSWKDSNFSTIGRPNCSSNNGTFSVVSESSNISDNFIGRNSINTPL